MKKLVPLGIVMLIGGIAIGICVAQFEISQYVPRFGDDEYAGADTIGDSQEDGPRVTMVTGSDFNFGVMEIVKKQRLVEYPFYQNILHI